MNAQCAILYHPPSSGVAVGAGTDQFDEITRNGNGLFSLRAGPGDYIFD